MLSQCMWRSKEGVRSPGTAVTDIIEPQMCMLGNPKPLKEQKVFLATEPSLQSPHSTHALLGNRNTTRRAKQNSYMYLECSFAYILGILPI